MTEDNLRENGVKLDQLREQCSKEKMGREQGSRDTEEKLKLLSEEKKKLESKIQHLEQGTQNIVYDHPILIIL